MPGLQTDLTRLLGIDHPILLAPMGSAAGGALAAAVGRAGGLGFIGSGYADRDTITRELREAGNIRVGIGLIGWALDKNPDVLDTVLEAGPPAVLLSFNDPTPYVDKIKTAGATVICQVQSLAQAKVAAAAGVDVIVAQGRDAGGHSGTMRGTIGLVPAIVDAVGRVPVVAAGGIADGRGLAAALSLGASGVLMGTRFATSTESLWDEGMKTRVFEGASDDTAQTRVFDIVRNAPWPSHYPGRALRNEFFDRWDGDVEGLVEDREQVEQTYLATKSDDFTNRVVWAGEGTDLISGTLSAEQIIQDVVAEAVAEISRISGLVR